MIDRSLIRRYVAAVHELAEETGEVEAVRGQLERLQTAIRSDPRVSVVLRHPQVPEDEKRDLLLRLAQADPQGLVGAFVDVLLRKDRAEVLEGAAEVFGDLADEAAGVIRARVTTAWDPDPERRRRLEAALSRLFGAPVVADYETAPEVLGGARVAIRGQLMDGTLAGRLAQMARQVGGEQ
jgi:F-type H+-transporting ATPase subunit delta